MQIITFRDKTTNCSQRREGIGVGEYLAVTKDAFIYKIRTGRKLFATRFESYEEALDFAELLDQRYKKYFSLWEIWEDADIFRLARYSVRSGNTVLKILDRLESGESLEEIKNELSRQNRG